MSRTVYIETYGCQMNEADAELMSGILGQQGYRTVDAADDADVVLINTCAIREKAEDRIFGRLGWLKPLKQARPELVLGVTGCMAEHLRDALATRTPYVDLVAGPDAYRRLPQLIEQASRDDASIIDVRLDREELYAGLEVQRRPGVRGYVTIMRGCDKFCSFCIVPYVRGRERSLAPDEIVRQVEQMVANGYKEVTLLGQTVSSYRVDGCDFAELLRRVHAVGIERIRFTSPWPSDFDDRLLQTLVDLPRVGRHLHLPLQSGSSRILRDMRRQYSAEDFIQLVAKIRRQMGEFAISTDIIVGFPGETEADFQCTLDLCAEAEFDSAFMFKYSERSMTQAARALPDDVPESLKGERLQRLIKLQERSSRRRSAMMIGKTVQVLVDGINPRRSVSTCESGASEQQMIGRSSCFKTTVLPGACAVGQMVEARVERSTTHTLFARRIT